MNQPARPSAEGGLSAGWEMPVGDGGRVLKALFGGGELWYLIGIAT